MVQALVSARTTGDAPVTATVTWYTADGTAMPGPALVLPRDGSVTVAPAPSATGFRSVDVTADADRNTTAQAACPAPSPTAPSPSETAP
jgi:hypothetical protein